MIYELARDVGSKLRARKFPISVVYGPERVQREGYDPIIVVERDRTASDTVTAPPGNQRNARLVRVRTLSAVATIYARSSLPGARVNDHERECERIVDAMLVALYEWSTETRAGDIPISEARYLSAADRADVETWPGVIYVMRFRVPRGVRALTYTDEARPEAELAGSTHETHATVDNGDPETVC